MTVPRLSADTTLDVSGWDALLDAVAHECATSVERTVEHMRAMPSYAALDPAALRVVVRGNHDAILAGLRLRRPPTAQDVTNVFEGHGRVRAQQGVVVSDMLAAWRVGQESLYMLASTQVAEPERDAVLREFLELLVQWVDVAMLAAVDGHRRAELTRAREQHHATGNLIRRLIAGAAAPGEIRMAAAAVGLDPDVPYHAVRARPDPSADVNAIEHYLGADIPAARGQAMTALIDGDVCGCVGRLPKTAAPAIVGVSGPLPLRDMEGAFRQAGRALETALALGVRGVFDLTSLGVRGAVATDDDVGEAMVRRYVAPFAEMAGGELILETVERYLDNDARVDATAHALDVHSNTVRHRLNRFEERTGRSLRETETVVEVWWALQRRRMN